jgi:ribonucleoside-diphosphate reductase alpha chain
MAIDVTPSNGELESFAVPPEDKGTTGASPEIQANAPGELRVIRRNGKVTSFDANKIAVAMTKAFLAVEGGSAAASRRVHDLVRQLTEQLADALRRRNPPAAPCTSRTSRTRWNWR